MNLTIQAVVSAQTDDASVVVVRQVLAKRRTGESDEDLMERTRQEITMQAKAFAKATVDEVMPPINVTVGLAPDQ